MNAGRSVVALLVLLLGAILIILWMQRVVDYPFFITGSVLSLLGLYWFGVSFVDGMKPWRPPTFSQDFQLGEGGIPLDCDDGPQKRLLQGIYERMPPRFKNPTRTFRVVKQIPPDDRWSGPNTHVVDARPAYSDTFIDKGEEMPGPWHVQIVPP